MPGKDRITMQPAIASVFALALAIFLVCVTNHTARAGEHDPFIRRFYSLAHEAMDRGDHPFGALLAKDGRVAVTARNTVKSDNDILAHVETNLITRAVRQLKTRDLSGYTLYTSVEPCIMCTGTIYLTGIQRVVFGLSSEALSRLTGWQRNMDSRLFLAQAKRKVAVVGPVLEPEGIRIFKSFLNRRLKVQPDTE